MNNELKLRTLTDRFFDGLTTLDEERQLYAYYVQEPERLPADLRPLRQLFLDLDSVRQAPQAPKTARASRWLRRGAAAAVAALLLVGGIQLFFRSNNSQDSAAGEEYVAYIYGQRTTDRDVVLFEMRKTMMAMSVDGSDIVEEQLKAMFSND